MGTLMLQKFNGVENNKEELQRSIGSPHAGHRRLFLCRKELAAGSGAGGRLGTPGLGADRGGSQRVTPEWPAPVKLREELRI